jgi:hypothetical protein
MLLPLLYAKKEVFIWLKQGLKTIDVRKGEPLCGEFALFQSGPYSLKFRIVARESGKLSDVIRVDNFRQVIPTARGLEDAFAYLRRLYGDYDGVFTAYHIVPLEQ